MSPRAGLLAAALVLPFGLGVGAARADMADRRLAALHLVEAAADDALIMQLARDPVQQLMRSSHAARADLTSAELLVLSALYHEEMQRAAHAALRERAAQIAARYSLEEIAALRAFAATAEGAEVLAVDTGLTGGLDRAIGAAMLAQMDAAFARYGRGVP